MLEWRLNVQRTEFAEYLMDAPGRNKTKRLVNDHLNGPPSAAAPPQPTPQGLQRYADDYGEQVTYDTAADVDKYFRYYHIPGATVGGLPTGISPLGVAAVHVKYRSGERRGQSLVVNGTTNASAAATYRALVGDLQNQMNRDTIKRPLRRAGHSVYD